MPSRARGWIGAAAVLLAGGPLHAGLEVRPGPSIEKVQGDVTALAVSDGGAVVAGSSTGEMRIGGSVEGRSLRSGGSRKGVTAVAIHASSKLVAAVTADPQILLLSTEGAEIFSEKLAAEGTAVAFSDDGNWLAAGTERGTLKVWPISRDTSGGWHAGSPWEVPAGKGPIRKVSISGNEMGVVIGKEEKTRLKVWDVATQRILTGEDGLPLIEPEDPSRSKISVERRSIESAAFSGATGLLAVGHHMAELPRDMNLHRGAVKWRNKILIYRGGRLIATLSDDNLPYVRGLSFGLDGRLLASAIQNPLQESYNITLWDTELERDLRAWSGMRLAAMSPNGTFIALSRGAGGESETASLSYSTAAGGSATTSTECKSPTWPAAAAAVEQSTRPTVTVFRASGYDASRGNDFDIAYLEAVAAHAAGTVARTGLFKVVEAKSRADVLKEQKFSLTDFADPEARAHVGQLLAGDYLLGADVTRSERSILVNTRLASVSSGQILNVGTHRTASVSDDAILCAVENSLADLVSQYRQTMH